MELIEDDVSEGMETDDKGSGSGPSGPSPNRLRWTIASTLQCVVWVPLRPLLVDPYNATPESAGRAIDALERTANGIGETMGPVFAITMATMLSLHCYLSAGARKRAWLAALSATPLLTELAFGQKRNVELWVWGWVCLTVTLSALFTTRPMTGPNSEHGPG